MDLRDAIYGRRAIRDYRPEAPSADLLALILTDAVQAPNSIDRQGWSFVVLHGRSELAECSRQAKDAARASLPHDAPADLSAMLANPEFDIFYNAPALIVIVADSAEPMLVEDCCLAAATLMLSAHAHGLGTCPIGFADAWLKTPQARTKLEIPEHRAPVMAIIIGVPATIPPPPGRRPPIIRWLGAPLPAKAIAAVA